ncbi:hypothetical protein ACWGPT_07205 [Pseudorhizobium sp. NPDC055634]
MRFKAIVFGAGIFVGCIIVWFGVLALAPKSRETNWIGEIYAKKERVAASLSSPKHLLIGGSSTHYSYSAEVASKLTGFNVVNLGTHAGLGADYILTRAKRSLKAGDTALLALEHQLLATAPPSIVLTRLVATTDPYFLLDAPLPYLADLIFGYSPAQFLRDTPAKLLPWTSPLYRSETVTDYGDESANSPENKLPYMLDVVRETPPITAAAPQSLQLADSFQDFVAWAQANDVTVFYTWPPTTDRPQYRTPEYAEYFQSYVHLFEATGINVLGRQTEYLIPEDEMLDSMYHADTRGARRASQVLSKNLCSVVVCPAASSQRSSEEADQSAHRP